MRLHTPPHPFIGRVDELAALGLWSEDVLASGAGVSLVLGESGSGKSTLVSKLAAQWRDRGGMVLAGGGVALAGLPGLQSPYGVLAEAIGPIAHSRDLEPKLRTEAADWVEPARDLRTDLDPAHYRHNRLLALIRKVAETRAVLLCIEDLQWTDPSSLASIIFLTRHLHTESVGMLTTARLPADGQQYDLAAVDAALEHLRRIPNSLTLQLGPMTNDESASLARAHDARDPEHIKTIVRLAEGNPLATVEMASAVEGDTGVETPRSIQAAVRGHWVAASGQTRMVLAACSAIGHDIPAPLLSEVLEASRVTDAENRAAAISEATRTGLIARTRGGYRFRHVLDQQAVYELADRGLVITLHRNIALALVKETSLSPGNAQLLARLAAHWAQAQDDTAAASASLDAGIAALRIGALPEAHQHLVTAIASLGTGRLDVAQCHAGVAEIALALRDTCRGTGMQTDGLRLLEAWSRRLIHDDVAWLNVSAAGLLLQLGRLEASDEAFRVALESATNRQVRAEVKIRFAAALAMRRDGRAHRLAEQGLAEIGSHDCWARGLGLVVEAVYLGFAGDGSAAKQRIIEAQLVAECIGDESLLWLALGFQMAILTLFSNVEDGAAVARATIRRARSGNLLKLDAASGCLSKAAMNLTNAGYWDEASELIADVTDGQEPRLAASAGLVVAKVLIESRRGQFASAAASLPWLRQLVWGPSTDILEIHQAEAEYHLLHKDHAAAATAIESGLLALGYDPVTSANSNLDSIGFVARGLSVSAEAARDPLLRVRAEAIRETLLPFIDAALDRPTSMAIPWVAAHAIWALAEGRAAEGEVDPRQWDQVVSAWQKVGDPYMTAYSSFRNSECCLRAGDRRRATKLLQLSAAGAQALGALPLLDAIGAMSRRGRFSLELSQYIERGDVPPHVARFGLTGRECDVLKLLMEGRTDRQIGRSLFISERTVGVHVSHILGKLHVSSRGEAAALAHSLPMF